MSILYIEWIVLAVFTRKRKIFYLERADRPLGLIENGNSLHNFVAGTEVERSPVMVSSFPSITTLEKEVSLLLL